MDKNENSPQGQWYDIDKADKYYNITIQPRQRLNRELIEEIYKLLKSKNMLPCDSIGLTNLEPFIGKTKRYKFYSIQFLKDNIQQEITIPSKVKLDMDSVANQLEDIFMWS